MKKQAFLAAVMILSMLLPACGTLQCGSRSSHFAISKAKRAVAHAGERYLRKKTEKAEPEYRGDYRGDHTDSRSCPAVLATHPEKHLETISLKSQTREMLDLILHEISFAVDWDEDTLDAQYPSDALHEISPCYLSNGSASASRSGRDAKPRARLAMKYGHRKLFVGIRWKFITDASWTLRTIREGPLPSYGRIAGRRALSRSPDGCSLSTFFSGAFP